MVMGKYSSDSDNEKRASKSSYKSRSRRRSSSSESSSSRNKRRGRSHRSRSKSGDRRSKSRRSRSKSYKGRSYHSRDKVRQHRRSSSRDHHKSTRARSKDGHRRRRSRSRSYIREYTNKPKKQSSTSSSSDSDSGSEQSRGSSKSKGKIASKESNHARNGSSTNVKPKVEANTSPDVIIVDSEVLDNINSDGFSQKKFTSGKNKKVPENIVIDLKKQTIKVPEVEPVEPDSIFHHNLFLSEEARTEKWVKELYSFRQKSLQQGIRSSN